MATMISPLRRAVQVAADRPAVVCGHTRLTYAEMWERCRRLVGALRALGLEEGDRIGVVSPNCHRYLEIYQAVPGAGFVLVPLNQRHSDAELRYALEDAGENGHAICMCVAFATRLRCVSITPFDAPVVPPV